MSTEYIERWALMAEIGKHIETIGANAERLVARFPAADVEPVVHGEWKHNSNRPDRLICSVCDAGYDMMRFESKDLKFCPNCGARMDLEEGK